MYRLRPSSFSHINLRRGVYWHPFLVQRAQIAKLLQRRASLVAANRLTTAKGQELRDYIASEYEAIPEIGTTYAIGSVTFVRETALTSGDIPAGTRLIRRPNLTSRIPLRPAQYETLLDVHFEVGQLTAGPVPIRATSPGAQYNHPIRTDEVAHGVIIDGGSLFDTGITVDEFSAAGGSDGVDDTYARTYARAYSKGQYAPTKDASFYGALRGSGVRHPLVFDVVGEGYQKVLIADSTWSSSEYWADQVEQSLYDNDLVGFGCRVVVDVVRNVVVSVSATVVLRDTIYLNDTREIDNTIRKAIREYFDDRKDWNVWSKDALKAAITRCDSRILDCTSAALYDTDGNQVSENEAPDYTVEQFHYYVANNACSLSFVSPS